MARGSEKSTIEFSIEDVFRQGFLDMPDEAAIYEKWRLRVIADATEHLHSPSGSLEFFFDQMSHDFRRALDGSSQEDLKDLLELMTDKALTKHGTLVDYTNYMFQSFGIPAAESLATNHTTEIYKETTPILYDYMKDALSGDSSSLSAQHVCFIIWNEIDKKSFDIAGKFFSNLDAEQKARAIVRCYPVFEAIKPAMLLLEEAIEKAYGPDPSNLDWSPAKGDVKDIFKKEWERRLSLEGVRANVAAMIVGTFFPDAIPHFLADQREDPGNSIHVFRAVLFHEYPEIAAKPVPSTFKRLLKRKR